MPACKDLDPLNLVFGKDTILFNRWYCTKQVRNEPLGASPLSCPQSSHGCLELWFCLPPWLPGIFPARDSRLFALRAAKCNHSPLCTNTTKEGAWKTRACLLSSTAMTLNFSDLTDLAWAMKIHEIRAAETCWNHSQASIPRGRCESWGREHHGSKVPKNSSLFLSGCYPVWSCFWFPPNKSSWIDTQCLHRDRKGEVWDRDARFGHFLDQPDKIKIENKIQNHAKDLSSKKKNCWIQNAKNDQTNRKDGTSFLSSQVFLDIVRRTRNWSQRVKRLARTAPSRMVLYLGNHHISTSKTFSQNSHSQSRNIWETSDVKKKLENILCQGAWQYLPWHLWLPSLQTTVRLHQGHPSCSVLSLGKNGIPLGGMKSKDKGCLCYSAMAIGCKNSFQVKSLKCIQSVDREHVGDHCLSISARQIAQEISAVKGPNLLSKDWLKQYIIRCASIDKKQQWHLSEGTLVQHRCVIAARKWHQWRVRHGVWLHTILTGKQWWQMLNGMNVDSRTE